MKARHRLEYHEQHVSIIELTDDQDELIELLSDAVSLRTLAENDVKFRAAEIALIKSKLKKLRSAQQTLRVTDHAIVRYLERKTKMDMKALRAELLGKLAHDFNPDAKEDIVEEIHTEGLRYVIRDNLIITVTAIEDAAETNILKKGEV